MLVKLISVSMFLLMGAAVGFAFYRIFNSFNLIAHLLIGAVGAFFGMWLADMADIQLGGNVLSSLLFSAAGAALLLSLYHLVRKLK